MDTFGNELKNVKGTIDKIDLSQYVPLNDFTNAQKEIEALKKSLDQVSEQNKEMESQLSQLAQLSQLTDIREELNELKKLKELKSLVEKSGKLEKEVESLKSSVSKTTKDLSGMKKKTKTEIDKMGKKIDQMGEGAVKRSTDIKRLEDDFDPIRQELIDLEDLIHTVKAQTIGSMIETGYATSKQLAQEGFEVQYCFYPCTIV